MKRVRLDRWAIQLQPPRNPRLYLLERRCPFSCQSTASVTPRREVEQRKSQAQYQVQHCQKRHAASRRKASSAAAAATQEVEEVNDDGGFTQFQSQQRESSSSSSEPQPLNSPSRNKILRSAKLSALHARLSLPSTFPLQTLARCLIDPSVDSRPGYNNAPLALLGQDLLGYYTAEWLLCHYPRLPMPVLFAAQYAYVGAATLAAMRAEWGVEVVAAPGPEVDPGLLQLKRVAPGNAMAEGEQMRVKDMPMTRRIVGSGRRNEEWNYRRGMSSRIVYDDQFGDLQSGLSPIETGEVQRPFVGASISTKDDGETYPLEGVESSSSSAEPHSETPDALSRPNLDGDTPSSQLTNTQPTTLETASANFIRALFGALYLHTSTPNSPSTVQSFHTSHILSRHLPLHTLFHFTHPTRDLSRLCAREGFEPPVARLISETSRLSRTPVFVVGVYSGGEKLGEGAGGSLNEGRVRAAAAALRSWYLYSPPEEEVKLPSSMEGSGRGEEGKRVREAWRPQLVDIGEIVT